jgi:hypothetical protein
MVLGRFEHLLHDTHFESSVNPIEDHKWLDYEVRPMNYFISYSKKGISKFDDWLSNQKDEWVTGQPCHILTEWHRFSKYVLNDQLVVDSESTKRKWAKHFNLQSRHEFCGITIPLWFRFPIIDLDQDFNLFYELILRDDSKT